MYITFLNLVYINSFFGVDKRYINSCHLPLYYIIYVHLTLLEMIPVSCLINLVRINCDIILY